MTNSNLPEPITKAVGILKSYAKKHNLTVIKGPCNYQINDDNDNHYGFDISDNKVHWYTWGLEPDHQFITYINNLGIGLDIM